MKTIQEITVGTIAARINGLATAVAFCDELEAAGYWVGIYSYKFFLESGFSPEILKRYAVWWLTRGWSKPTSNTLTGYGNTVTPQK